MTNKEFETLTHEIIPQQLFHVESTDLDDETGAKLEEVILIGLIANNLSCLSHKPLSWFTKTYLGW
jgi:hypothetical protein